MVKKFHIGNLENGHFKALCQVWGVVAIDYTPNKA